jgi:hypothetical protein
MGRKSSAKARPAVAGSPPPQEPRTRSPLVIAGIVIVALAGLFVAMRSSAPDAAPVQTAAAPAASQLSEPQYARFGPHKQDRLPPLPFDGSPMARSADVVRAAYLFAAEHPEILAYVPCYCGCERSGHRGNDDCFVAGRDANGDVTQWEPHGMT